MPREINDTQQFTDKLVKFIPTEIIGAYMAIAGFLGFNPVATSDQLDKMPVILIQVAFAVLLTLTPVYLWMVGKVRHKLQIAIATGSFAVWVYTLGGPFMVWRLYDPYVSSFMLVIWSLLPPLFVNITPPTENNT